MPLAQPPVEEGPGALAVCPVGAGMPSAPSWPLTPCWRGPQASTLQASSPPCQHARMPQGAGGE
eukprot:9509716-Alexandrium_andersonii.AAC.1